MSKRSSGAPCPPRSLLQGVPRVRFYEGGDPGCPEDIPLPACVSACLEFLGDERFGCRRLRGCRPGCISPCAYAHCMGTSGAAAFLAWKPGWADDNLDIRRSSDDPDAPFREALAGAGYDGEVLRRDAPGRADWRARILESLCGRGRPVIAVGLVGPPESCLVTGYDEGGDVLIGWSFFQAIPPFDAGLEREPSGEFRVRDWESRVEAFVFIGERKAEFDARQAYRAALGRLVEIARAPATADGRKRGLAAYEEWAVALTADDWASCDDTVLRARFEVHDAAVGTLAECRWYGSKYLIEASDAEAVHHALTEGLLRAAACYAAVHALAWDAWALTGGPGKPDGYRKLAEPAVRAALAKIVMQAHDRDAEATRHIDAACNGVGAELLLSHLG